MKTSELFDEESFHDQLMKADKVEHPVEKQWHYPILTKHGFEPKTKYGTGFVRSYNYEHPSGRKIRVTTGASADYWHDTTHGQHGFAEPGQDNAGGYWSSLEPHVKALKLSESFVAEARIKGATYTTKEIKGKVEKVIAELRGQHSAAWTKISKQYIDLDAEIKKLQISKDELNALLKDKATEVFDVEDEVLTRVVETAQLTITLSKKVKTPAHEEVDAEKVVEALAKADLPKDLRKMVNEIIQANTKTVAAKETPERLTVKINEHVTISGLAQFFQGIINHIQIALSHFDSKYTKIAEMVKMLSVRDLE